MNAKTIRLISCLAILATLQATSACGQTVSNMFNYWIAAKGLSVKSTSVDFAGNSFPSGDAYWQGTLWGQTVALQGDPSMTRYDIFVINGSELDYYAEFESFPQVVAGNGYSDNSYIFSTPIVFMYSTMQVGQSISTAYNDKLLLNNERKWSEAAAYTAKVTLNAYYASYTVPENGMVWQNVVQLSYNSDPSNPDEEEDYWLAYGYGPIRTVLHDSTPSTNVSVTYATGSIQVGQITGAGVHDAPSKIQYPTLPWFDPFTTPDSYGDNHNVGYIPNRFFLDNDNVEGTQVKNGLSYWDQSSGDCVITKTMQTPGTGTGPWTVCLRGSQSGGDSVSDHITTSTFIPVNPGATYTISGWVYRTSTSDNVYIDTDDGAGAGQTFPDAQANAQSVNQWEFVSATTTVGSGTTGMNVRCVRDGANVGNAYFYGISLQRQ